MSGTIIVRTYRRDYIEYYEIDDNITIHDILFKALCDDFNTTSLIYGIGGITNIALANGEIAPLSSEYIVAVTSSESPNIPIKCFALYSVNHSCLFGLNTRLDEIGWVDGMLFIVLTTPISIERANMGYICDYCMQTEATTKTRFPRCTCKAVHYCSTRCQYNDWDRHKINYH